MKAILALCLTATCLVACAPAVIETDDEYREEIDAWHAGRLERLQSETGWLTLVGLHPLAAGSQSLGSGEEMDVRMDSAAPPYLGDLEIGADAITLTAAPDVELAVLEEDGSRPFRRATLQSDADGPATLVECGPLVFHVIDRGGSPFLRVKDRQSAVRLDFDGIERFEVDPAWRVVARLVTEDAPASVPVANVLGHVSDEPVPGRLVFTLAGREHRLLPMGSADGPLFIVFGDRTNGEVTYGGGRFLSTEAPDSTGAVVLDFNRATNPPCAFTPYATCPLPPEGNVLPAAVTAGEKVWGEHHH